MKTLVLASRNGKEILRDQINLFFGIGFPVILLLLLTIIQSNVPVVLFPIDKLASGISVFGFSFLSLFSGVLIAKDRTSSFMLRLFAAPLTSSDFIFGYTLPMLPMAVLQVVACFAVAFLLGLDVNMNVVLAIIVLMPAAILFIAIGLLAGSIFNEKQVSGVC
ncbi:MAG TPA: ABC transporter permease [Fervidobacterium sp.]|nr:ABC transporter permease [Fervidobacterium sp.]